MVKIVKIAVYLLLAFLLWALYTQATIGDYKFSFSKPKEEKPIVSYTGVIKNQGVVVDTGKRVTYKEVFYALMICDRRSPKHRVKLKKIYTFVKSGNYVVCSDNFTTKIEKPTQEGPSF